MVYLNLILSDKHLVKNASDLNTFLLPSVCREQYIALFYYFFPSYTYLGTIQHIIQLCN